MLSTEAILWKRYPIGTTLEDGVSYQLFPAGSNLTIVGEQDWGGKAFIYILDHIGETFVAPSDYLSFRVRIMR